MTPDFHPEHSDITDEMWSEIDQIIADNKDTPGSIIGVLRECQDAVNWLPVELIDYISDGLNLSRSEVFGIASFYSLISLTPKGRHQIKVCMGTACYVKGIKEVMSRIVAMIAGDHPLSKIADELNRRELRNRQGEAWTQVGIFKLLPRIVEFGPEILSAESWAASKKKLLAEVS